MLLRQLPRNRLQQQQQQTMPPTPRLSKPTPSTASGVAWIVGGKVELPDGVRHYKVKVR